MHFRLGLLALTDFTGDCFRLRGFHGCVLLGESMGAIVWQEYRVFTGVNLTRRMTTRVSSNARQSFQLFFSITGIRANSKVTEGSKEENRFGIQSEPD